MGSGKQLRRAIKKYGVENFEKLILSVYKTEEEMNQAEKDIVTEKFCKREDTYNICEGGKGGFGYINKNGLGGMNDRCRQAGIQYQKNKKGLHPNNLKAIQQAHIDGKIKYDTWSGKLHSEETKKLMSKKAKERTGQKNSQYGTMWITNGEDNKKIKKIDNLPEGFKKGRINIVNAAMV